MARDARVGSLDELSNFRNALTMFATTVRSSISETFGESQRMLMWLKHDQFRHWSQQVRYWSEQRLQARAVLKRKETIEKSPVGGNYSYIDERRALSKAERNEELAREKLKYVKKGIQALEQEVHVYKGQMQSLMGFLELDIPTARAVIERMLESLEAYLEMQLPSDQSEWSNMTKPIQQGEPATSEPESEATDKE